MSQRSIVEINHDFAHKIDGADDVRVILGRLLSRALASGSEESWAELRRFGIIRITQCHHSEERKVIVGKGALQREYEIG